MLYVSFVSDIAKFWMSGEIVKKIQLMPKQSLTFKYTVVAFKLGLHELPYL